MQNQNYSFLCKFNGGSHLYGLNTPSSDLDERGVYVNTSLSDLLGLTKCESVVIQNEKEDKSYTELRHFLRLLKNGNTQALEALWAPSNSFNELTDEWKMVQEFKLEFTDSEKIFRCLSGYSMGELKLANGERTGLLGSKRKQALEKYGFSPKNFTNLFRLLTTGIHFFNTGEYLVNFTNTEYHKFLFDLKTQPEHYKKEDLNNRAAEYDLALKKAFDNRKQTFKFNDNRAEEIALLIYAPLFQKHEEDFKMKYLLKRINERNNSNQ